MKLTTNNYLFSNFKTEFTNESVSKNSLSINNIYNLSTQNRIIEPVCNFSNLLNECFGNEFVNLLKSKYFNTLNNINISIKKAG